MPRIDGKNHTARRHKAGDKKNYLGKGRTHGCGEDGNLFVFGEDFRQEIKALLLDDERMARIQADLERRGVIPELERLFSITQEDLLRALHNVKTR